MTNVSDIIGYVSIAVDITLCLICICWVYSFYLLRKNECIAPRLPISSVFVGILCIIGLSVTFPLVILLINITSIPDFAHQSGVMSVLILLTIIGLYHVFTFRAFVVYFHIKWQLAIEDRQWRIYIDPSETDWYLNNRNIWGNWWRVAAILGIHLLFWAFLIFIFLLIIGDENVVRLLLGCSGLLPTIADLIMYILFPKFDDIWGITREIKWTLALELFVIIVLSTVSYILDVQHHTIEAIAFSDISAICLFIYVYIMHYQPLKDFNLPTNPFSVIQYLESQGPPPIFDAQSINISTVRASSKKISGIQSIKQEHFVLTLKDVLSDENGFVQFARHLTHSFCIETLLFLVETQQWLESVSTRASVIALDHRFLFTLPQNAPISKIVVDRNEDNDEYVQSAKLFKKYIVNGAYFCLNISARTRSALYQQFGYNDDLFLGKSTQRIAQYLRQQNVSHDALFHSFDMTRKEVYKLMDSSYSVFRRSNVFQELKNSIFVKKYLKQPNLTVITQPNIVVNDVE